MSRQDTGRKLAALAIAGAALSACAVYEPAPAYPPGYYYAPGYAYPPPAYGSFGFYFGDDGDRHRRGHRRHWD